MSNEKLWSFDDWRNWAVGRHIDIDGAYGAQCWDAFADYAIRVVGSMGLEAWTSGNAGADTGLVSSIWTKFPARPGIDKRFYKVSPNEAPRKGDVPIWGRSRPFPWSHIGMATGRTRPGQIETISQNLRGTAAVAAGAVSVDWLTTEGLLGYLRPFNNQDGEEDLTPEQDKMLRDVWSTLSGGIAGVKHRGEIHTLIGNLPSATSAAVLDTPVARSGIDAEGKPRTGDTSLRKMVGHHEHQIGLTRRIVERIESIVKTLLIGDKK